VQWSGQNPLKYAPRDEACFSKEPAWQGAFSNEALPRPVLRRQYLSDCEAARLNPDSYKGIPQYFNGEAIVQ